MYRLVYSENAAKDLRRIEKKEAQRIVKKIHYFSQQQDIRPYSKPLKKFDKKYRFRIGNYRAVFSIDQSGEIHVLLILKSNIGKIFMGRIDGENSYPTCPLGDGAILKF